MAASVATASLLRQLAGGAPPRRQPHVAGLPEGRVRCWRPSASAAPAAGASAPASGVALAASLLGVAVGSAVAQRRGGRRSAASVAVVVARAAPSDTLVDEEDETQEDETTISTGEIYRLLKGSPSMTKALRLAARLRRAAREGRALKDGRSLKAEYVDKAMDALLVKVERVREAKKRRIEKAERSQQETERQEERREERPQPPPPPRPQAQAPRSEWEGGELGEEWQPAPARERELKAQRPQERKAPRPVAKLATNVPEEVKAQIVNNKYNYVDRVWRAPSSENLPQAPWRDDDDSLPDDSWLRLPHIAVNGMTNTGKSTLINHCLRWDYAAKASSMPGRTDSIDFYLVNNRFVLVDLPGYPDPDEIAYLGVTRNWESHWEDLVLSYLEMCASRQYDLRLLLQLQMTKRRPSRMCVRFAAECERLSLPMLLVMTKDDQMKDHYERNYWAEQIRKHLRVEGPHLHYTSSTQVPSSRKSRKQLHRWMRSAINAGSGKEAKDMLRSAWVRKEQLAEAAPQEAERSEDEVPAPPVQQPEEVQR